MDKKIERLKGIRGYLLDLIKDLSNEELNEIPEGFNNNIIWNMAHLIATEQRICYARSGQPLTMDQEFVEKYKAGTKPEETIDHEEVDNIKKHLISSLEQLDADYRKGLFNNYTPWDTRYGIALNNIDDTLDFMLYHDGLHTGYIMALKRLV